MTRTPRLSKRQRVELAPNQIYLKRPGIQNRVHTLVEGSTDWSYYSWASGPCGLYYKGWFVTILYPLEAGRWVDEHVLKPDPFWQLSFPPFYTSLAEVVAVYEQVTERLATFDKWNNERGLDEWCVRHSFTPSLVSVALPPEERKRLERLTDFQAYRSVEEMLLDALYRHLARAEETFHVFQQWQQEQDQQGQEAPAEVGA
jgi:hypothetical protein